MLSLNIPQNFRLRRLITKAIILVIAQYTFFFSLRRLITKAINFLSQKTSKFSPAAPIMRANSLSTKLKKQRAAGAKKISLRVFLKAKTLKNIQFFFRTILGVIARRRRKILRNRGRKMRFTEGKLHQNTGFFSAPAAGQLLNYCQIRPITSNYSM